MSFSSSGDAKEWRPKDQTMSIVAQEYRQKDASLSIAANDITSGHLDVKSEDLTQFIKLEDGISCKFEPGMIVVDLELGEDQSPTIVVSGFSSLVSEKDVRIFGKDDKHRKSLAAQVRQLCQEAEIETHALPIPPADFEKILLSGRRVLDQAMRGTRCRKISLDIGNRSLLVEGTPEKAIQVKAFLSKLLHATKDGSRINEDHCPICFCPPDDGSTGISGMTRLSCGHVYCGECFQTWLTGDNLCEFPLICLSDGCRSPVSLVDLKKSLSFEDFTGLLRKALDDHVRKTPSIQFCLTPTCSGLFTTAATQRLSTCSTCLETICNECKAIHGTTSCADYRLMVLPPDRLRMKIVDEILTLRCPGCSQAFLDFEGCFALACSVCPCHFCGWCLKDCGLDAHAHVATCPEKVGWVKPGTSSYCGTKEEFESAQNQKRINELRKFLSSFALEERKSIITSIGKDLSDLGMTKDLL